MGLGQFVEEADIATRKPMFVSDVIGRLPGVLTDERNTFKSRMRLRYGRKQCEPSVWIDGVELFGKTQDLDAYVDVDNIRAMEVYRYPAAVPLAFAGDPGCGAILIWRKQ